VILVFTYVPLLFGGGIAYIFGYEMAANVVGIAGMLPLVGIVAYFVRALRKTGPPFDTFRGFLPGWPVRR
jgi:hypothetical protein